LTGESEVPFTLITGCDAMLKHRHVWTHLFSIWLNAGLTGCITSGRTWWYRTWWLANILRKAAVTVHWTKQN
jgi:hypothetical protein